MKLKIELKSDLCTSSGENYNAYIDTDVVYDRNGFPYIPAKRLKGVIREAALELTGFGIFEISDYQELFGMEGIQNSRISIDDAYLENYADEVAALEQCEKESFTHPQSVLSRYTYVRTQTALTKEGTAKENSLRTFRVVKSGVIFAAEIKKMQPLSAAQEQLLKSSIRMVKHMGMSRTRGLGMVELTLLDEEAKTPAEDKKFPVYDQNKIFYKIILNGPLRCKTADGNQEKTEEFISGSKVLGMLAGMMKDRFGSFMGYDADAPKELIVSNAYICAEDQRCTPIPASYQKKKDEGFVDEALTVWNMLCTPPDQEQRTPFRDGYLSDTGILKLVETQLDYHHKRPENKAIGRADGSAEASFYQFRSICKGQSFAGYMLADREQTEEILKTIKGCLPVRLGSGRQTEYGNAQIEITAVEQPKNQTLETNEFVVKLNSAVILYNEYGMPSSQITCLQDSLEKVLHTGLTLKKCFVTYEEIGGFQVTWHRRKPRFTALGKGSAFLFECSDNIKPSLPKELFIGERVSEGYGEAEILALTDQFRIRKEREREHAKSCD